jgi:hypothetical protein
MPAWVLEAAIAVLAIALVVALGGRIVEFLVPI